jgi:hypothetical protein
MFMNQVAQTDIIQVWPDQVPDADLWRDVGPELERPPRENSRLVRNVSQPTMKAFLPEPSIAVGTGVIVCPGSAGFALRYLDRPLLGVAPGRGIRLIPGARRNCVLFA